MLSHANASDRVVLRSCSDRIQIRSKQPKLHQSYQNLLHLSYKRLMIMSLLSEGLTRQIEIDRSNVKLRAMATMLGLFTL